MGNRVEGTPSASTERPVVRNITWNYSGEVVIVTGAAHGMGRAIATSFARAGADVAIFEIGHNVETVPYDLSSPEEIDAVAEECRALGARVLPVTVDLRDTDAVKTAVEAVVAEFGRIDILVCNHGIHTVARVVDMPEQQWDVMLDTNLKADYNCARFVAPHMIAAGKGSIVNLGSTLSHLGLPLSAHYSAAKHGVIGFSKGLAIELAPHGINVNVLCPGGVGGTRLEQGIQQETAFIEELGKYGPYNLFDDDMAVHPEDIANGVLFLASDAARYITGESLLVDQGSSIK
jgi:NAD(P)-dependent dehydrogenase (short-subunit alcohol dehydrogenase family)